MGGLYQVTDGAVTKYYAIAGIMVAMDDGSGMKYLLTDHREASRRGWVRWWPHPAFGLLRDPQILNNIFV